MQDRTGSRDPDPLLGILARTRIGGRALEARAREAEQLTQALRSILPAEVAAHCLWATAEGKTVLLVTDNGSWATRLRFEQSRLVEQARQLTGTPLTSLRVLIIPASEWIAPVPIPEPRE